MRERDIEKILVEEIRKAGGRAYKFVSPGNDGVPDRLIVLPGSVPIFVELKTETGKLSKIQEAQVQFLRKCYQKVYVLYGMHDLIRFFYWINLPDVAERLEDRYGVRV